MRARDNYAIRKNPRRSYLEGRRPRRLVATRDIKHTKHSYPWAPRPVPLQIHSMLLVYLQPARPPALQSNDTMHLYLRPAPKKTAATRKGERPFQALYQAAKPSELRFQGMLPCHRAGRDHRIHPSSCRQHRVVRHERP